MTKYKPMSAQYGYLVVSHNGQGKMHFFKVLEDAIKFHEKKHPNWGIYEGFYCKEENSFQMIKAIIK